jgi:hypothetical protein
MPMAEVQLSRADVQGSRLPRICMQCGAPATDEIARKYTTDRVDVPPPPDEPVGCLVVWPILGLLKLFSWSSARTMTVHTPLCHKHAHGWFTWNTLDAKEITDENIILTGVSETFVRAWADRRPAEHPKPGEVIRVRCRGCAALNDESARFCNQCGNAL